MSGRRMPPKPAGSRWTDAQWLAIVAPGNVLVSAAAGSGKTAVLAERCAHAICDAAEAERCNVDQLLVVTFGEDAAAEMKQRIGQALRERFERSPDDKRLMRQVRLADRAQISTLHAFCAGLIRQHFHRLGLDPNFTLLDGDEAALLRVEVARALFAQRYEAEDDAFRLLVDCYADGNDERLIARLVKTHELLTSVVDPRRWMETSRRQISEPTIDNFDKSDLGLALHCEIDNGLATLATKCQSAREAISRMPDFHAYLSAIDQCEEIVKHWRALFSKNGVDALAEAMAEPLDLMRLPRIPDSVVNKKIAKDILDDLKNELNKGSLRCLASFTRAQWIDGLRRVRPHADAFLGLVSDFSARYHDEKSSLHVLDFADLEREALRLLSDDGRHPSSIARQLHRQFSRVMVDEYQDINEVQEAILKLLSRECLEATDEPLMTGASLLSPNLFCVGDVKQAIYRFRLAEPALFLERAERYRASSKGAAGTAKPGRLIDLQANFRSRSLLLDGINAIFRRLMRRDAAEIEYDDTHALTAGAKDFPKSRGHFPGGPIELHLLPDKPADADPADHDSPDADESPDRTEREADFVAQRIRSIMGLDASAPKKVWDKEQKQSRPIRFGDIVVLLRSMKFKADDFARRLRGAGIPVHADSSTGYFESTEVQDLLALLKVLDNRAQDIPLAAVLRSPIAALAHPEDTLVRIRLAEPTLGFHQAVVRYAHAHRDDAAAELRDLLKRIDRWRIMAQQRPLADVIWDIYDSTGYLAFCAGLVDGRQREANLLDLHARARQFGGFQRQGLARFLTFLDKLADESDLGQPSVVSPGENVVRIMSIHRSKGLEFPVVVVPDLGKKFNLLDCRGSILADRHAMLGMDAVDQSRLVRYPSLAWTIVQRNLRRQTLAEELRILYVAMTRAREHLILTGTCPPDALPAWRARWAGHRCALPVDAIQEANHFLDWLGPAAAAMDGAGEKLLDIHPHFDGDSASHENESQALPDSTDQADQARLENLAAMKPLTRPPAADPQAAAIIEALTRPYPFERFTRLPAVEAATALAKSPSPSPSPRAASRFDAALGLANLPLPRSIEPSLKPSAADVGQATHLVLQYLDFTRSCDRSDLEAQVADLTARRLISPAAGALVDLEALQWLHASAIGQLLRRHAALLRREFSLYLALDSLALAASVDPKAAADSASSSDPQDRIMVRCRIDALVETPRGHEIIDYKTDRVTADELSERVELYRPQLMLYRRAIERITGHPAAAAHLVFLAARQIVSC